MRPFDGLRVTGGMRGSRCGGGLVAEKRETKKDGRRGLLRFLAGMSVEVGHDRPDPTHHRKE